MAKYADMEGMSPETLLPAERPRPALGGNGHWVEGVIEAVNCLPFLGHGK